MITLYVKLEARYHCPTSFMNIRYLNFEISNTNLGASGIRGVAIYVEEDFDVSEVTFDTDVKDHL